MKKANFPPWGIETVLQDHPNVVHSFDDTVYANGVEMLVQVLSETLWRQREHAPKLSWVKCVFAVPVLDALKHKIDEHGVHKSDAHIEVIQKALQPMCFEDLQLFLSVVTYNSFPIQQLQCDCFKTYSSHDLLFGVVKTHILILKKC